MAWITHFLPILSLKMKANCRLIGLEFSCVIKNIRYENKKLKQSNTLVNKKPITLESLLPNETTSARCVDLIQLPSKIVKAEIEMNITYKPLFYFRKQNIDKILSQQEIKVVVITGFPNQSEKLHTTNSCARLTPQTGRRK